MRVTNLLIGAYKRQEMGKERGGRRRIQFGFYVLYWERPNGGARVAAAMDGRLVA